MSNLNLGGEISPAIGDLRNLQSMYVTLAVVALLFMVYCCSVYFLVNVLLKYFINDLSRDLQGNQLTGQIPDEIGNCISLILL